MRQCFILVSLFCALPVCADDWPQWQGPQRDGVWRESQIVEKFAESGPRILWRTPIGAGYAGPSVANGRVFVMGRALAATEQAPTNAFERGSLQGVERVQCLNETDGVVIWKYEYPCAYTVSYPAGPRVAPLVSGGHVFTLGAEGNLCCLDAANGKVSWSKDFKSEFNVKAPMWGFAGHPILEGNKLICLASGQGSTVVAFDKTTGKEIWRALSLQEPGYSSPIIVEAGGKRQLIIWHPEGAHSLNPESGEVYWSVPFQSRSGLTVSTPRKMGDELFFTSFYDGALMLKLASDKPAASELWRSPKGDEQKTTHLNSILCTPFLEDGYVYGVCSYGQLRCLKAETGERLWETLQATTSGNPVRWGNAFIVKNGGRYFLFNEKGDLIIAKLTPKGYEELSRAHLLEPTNKDCGRPVVWSHPAFANRHVYARNDKEIICADLSR